MKYYEYLIVNFLQGQAGKTTCFLISYTSSFLSHCDVKLFSMPETVAHRIIRSKHLVASKHLEVNI